eukprot:4157971-Heterocapsa_arctica.AAC.1
MGPPRTLRVKWVPSHMKEEDIRKGTITKEDRDGHEEADKLAMRRVEMHKVPMHIAQAMDKQDAMVE